MKNMMSALALALLGASHHTVVGDPLQHSIRSKHRDDPAARVKVRKENRPKNKAARQARKRNRK